MKDLEYFYEFGKWVGDRDGYYGAVGLSNMDFNLIKSTYDFLKKKTSNKIHLLIRHSSLTINEINQFITIFKEAFSQEPRIVNYPGMHGRYCFYVYAYDAILRREFQENLDDILSFLKNLTKEEFCAFIGGFFDAEGHFDKYNRKITAKLSKKSKLGESYHELISLIDDFLDVNCRKKSDRTEYYLDIGGNKEFFPDVLIFKSKILPFIKSDDKRVALLDIVSGEQFKDQYIVFLKYISLFEEIHLNKLKSDFKRKSINTLSNIISSIWKKGLINKLKPAVFCINKKGKKYLVENEELLNEILNYLKIKGVFRKMYKLDSTAIQKII